MGPIDPLQPLGELLVAMVYVELRHAFGAN